MRWEGQAYCSILPRVHGSIAPWLGNVLVVSLLWAVESQVFPAPYYFESWYHLLWVCTPGIWFQVRRMWFFQCSLLSLHCEVAWKPFIVFLDGLQGYSLGCRGGHLSQLVHNLGNPLALTFFLGICLENLQCPSVISCRNIYSKEWWWCKFWMHLDPI